MGGVCEFFLLVYLSVNAMTFGQYIYYNPHFFFSADDDEITFDPDDIITDIEQVIAIL